MYFLLVNPIHLDRAMATDRRRDRDFSVLGLAQLLRKEKDFLSVLAFYTTAIEANKAKVKGYTVYMQEC